MSEQQHSRGTTRVCLTRCPLPPPEANVHCLPCRIHYDGKAPVKNYFRPEPLTGNDHVQDVSALEGTHATKLRAEFRGIQLQGEQFDVRALGYQGAHMCSCRRACCCALCEDGDSLSLRLHVVTNHRARMYVDLLHRIATGLVLEDSGVTHPDDEGKVWEVDHHFDAFTYWCVCDAMWEE